MYGVWAFGRVRYWRGAWARKARHLCLFLTLLLACPLKLMKMSGLQYSSMLVIFSAMKGTDHSKRSKKFGRKYG